VQASRVSKVLEALVRLCQASCGQMLLVKVVMKRHCYRMHGQGKASISQYRSLRGAQHSSLSGSFGNDEHAVVVTA
jgi:hypothetical protein